MNVYRWGQDGLMDLGLWHATRARADMCRGPDALYRLVVRLKEPKP